MKKDKNTFDRDSFVRETDKSLGRLFHNKGVLTQDEEKNRIDNAVQFYADKMGEKSSPTQIAAIIYSEYAINHFQGSVARGYSALWNSVHAAFRGLLAFLIAVVVGVVATVFVLLCVALLLFSAVALIAVAVIGAFYLLIGFMGITANAASAMAFGGVGLIAAGVFLVFTKPFLRLFKRSGKYISIPIFALSICVRQYARSKRIHLVK